MNRNKRRALILTTSIVVSSAMSAELPYKAGSKHLGVATCATAQCHGSAVARDGSNVMQNEYVTWTQNDPHANSYRVLRHDQSKAMAARLGLRAAHTSDICLGCHADDVPDGKRGEKFQLSDGVGCEACHGGAEDWLSTHYNTPEVDHADNVAAGMYPTENVAARAELCLSCHFGNTDKFATHRIMAAGHPRLSFELDTFTELWRTAGRQPHYRIDADYRDRKEAASHSYAWAAGLLEEGRARLTLIFDGRILGSGMFPELALYDCHACHRSMKTVRWRHLSRHGSAGPGKPFINDGTFVMILTLTRAISPADAESLESALTALHVAGDDTIDTIRSAAMNLDSKIARVQSTLTEDRVRNRGRLILAEILRTGANGEFLDYVSAEQAFMAVQMLAFELDDSPLQAKLDTLAEMLEDDEHYRPAQFARLLHRLSEQFRPSH
ncbi:MAG: multiheme c-type cytochrome [Woeseia sp.]